MNLAKWLNSLERGHPKSIELGLERCGAVHVQLGSPRPAKRVFTVAGTNGKGSTVAYISAMCGSLGQSHGAYTSPHIFRFNERISTMGQPVSDECLVQAFEQVEVARGEIPLTYFEFTTLAGLLILQQAELDWAVLEVGLGGRLDTVNLIDADCTVITPIGLDHQDFLGSDLNAIATEKAGIMRPGVPVVCTQTNPPEPILQTAKTLHAPLYCRGLDFNLLEQAGPDSDQLMYSMGDYVIPIQRPSMGGLHQLDNLAAALAAVLLMNPHGKIKSDEISAAVKDCRVPGRLQKVHSSPEVLLDVGHNELAAEVIAEYLLANGRSNTTCILAMLADKSAEAVANALGKACGRWLCADSVGQRGQSGVLLANRIKSTMPDAEVHSFESVDKAMDKAFTNVTRDETILVFGSFTTVSAASGWLQKRLQQEGPDADKLT
jgi:dihydrofolate synthase/folylpolyglutamate synthase